MQVQRQYNSQPRESEHQTQTLNSNHTNQQSQRQYYDQQLSKGGQYGFKVRMFPLIGFIVGVSSIILSYIIARSKTPPDVPPFPQTDITHTGIKFPQYLYLRIGLMVTAPIIAICFQSLKNYLNMMSFQIAGEPAQGVKCFGFLSTLSCLALAISTASMSDGGDMNWTLHVICASSFFVISLFIVMRASKIYRKLWIAKNKFCPFWSYQIKKYTNFCIIGLISLQVMQGLKMIEIYSLVEWLATLFLMVWILTLYWDFKKMRIWLIKKKGYSQQE